LKDLFAKNFCGNDDVSFSDLLSRVPT